MHASLRYRECIADARRVIVKIGSRVLVQKTGRPEVRRIRSLVNDLARLNHNGHEIVIVTSGAIGAGMQALGMRARPTELPDLQMAAAVGQSRLMSQYDELFAAKRCKVGQLLLTHDDFHHKIRMTNMHRVIENLLRNRVIPIVNENDVVADEEIKADVKKLGDNDLLASLVTRLTRADLLIILTTVDGFRAPNGAGKTRRVSYLECINRKVLALAGGKGSHLSTGGMSTKLRAAQAVARAGAGVVIADGRRPGIIARIMRGEDTGTLVLPSVSG
jgi:glutamate 5-kinase